MIWSRDGDADGGNVHKEMSVIAMTPSANEDAPVVQSDKFLSHDDWLALMQSFSRKSIRDIRTGIGGCHEILCGLRL